MTQRPLVFAVVTHWNAYDDTAACLRSLAASDYPNLKTVVVNNGSTDDSIGRLTDDFPNVPIIHTGQNGSVIEAYNFGMQYGLDRDADHILMLNNDIEFKPDMISLLVAPMEADPTIGCTTPKIFFYDPPDLLWFAGAMLSRSNFSIADSGEGERDLPKYNVEKDVDLAYACGMLIRRTALDQIGLFDPQFYLYFDDLDISLRLLDAGYRIRYIPSAVMWHKVSQTTSGNARFTNIYARSRMRFYRKYAPPQQLLWLVPFTFLHGVFRMMFPLQSNMRMHDHPRDYFKGLLDGLRS